MEITRNVILDLLPLYSANEVSGDTRVLVESYLETDPELANVAKQMENIEKPAKIPAPLSRDDEMRAYRKARMLKFLIIVILAGVLSIFLLVILAAFFLSSS